jgi:hypothetical protein
VVGRSVVPALQARGSSSRPRIALEDSAWVAATSRDVVTFLRDHPGQVVGDLEDLEPPMEPEPGLSDRRDRIDWPTPTS